MGWGQDQNYLRNEQYKGSSNFMARVMLTARFSTNPYRWTHWLLDQIDAPLDARVLELGAGPAIFWTSNRDRFPEGWQITLSDFSPGMVDEACWRLRDIAGDFRFEVIDAQAIPHADESFDVIIANHMLYHVPEIPRALAEVRRVLKPNGKFYAATNGLSDMRELVDLVTAFGLNPGARRSPIRAFSLDNGAALMAPFFAQIELRRHANALEVTEGRPIIDYLLSAVSARGPEVEQMADRFETFLEQEIKKTGSLHFSKDSGLLIASNPVG